MPGLGQALHNFEARRKTDFEDWLLAEGIDAVVWPCNADVGKANADTNEESAVEAWLNVVLYSNGNCAIRQLGIPTVSVPMGIMAATKMPVNLTFAGKAYNDSALFKYAFAFEQATRLRQSPGRTPALPTDAVKKSNPTGKLGNLPPHLTVKTVETLGGEKMEKIRMSGIVYDELSELRLYVDGDEIQEISIVKGSWSVDVDISVHVHWSNVKPEERRVPDLGKVMVIILATGKNGRSSAEIVFV